MGSSVNFFRYLPSEMPYMRKIGMLTTTPRKSAFLRIVVCAGLGRFLHLNFLQMIFVKVKAAGYQP